MSISLNTSILTILLISISWTQSFAQTGSDTTKCYNKTELKKIATGLVRANECDSLLKLTELDVQKADSVIMAKDSIIIQGMIIIGSQETIIEGKQGDIDRLVKLVNKNDRQKKWLKVGWVTTALAELALIFYLMLN